MDHGDWYNFNGKEVPYITEITHTDLPQMKEKGVYYMLATGSYHCYFDGFEITHRLKSWYNKTQGRIPPVWVEMNTKRKETKC